jgi:hypothetical protein
MDLLVCGFHALAKTAIQQGATSKTCMQFVYKLNPEFEKDKIFKDLFPIIFELEKIEHLENKTSSAVVPTSSTDVSTSSTDVPTSSTDVPTSSTDVPTSSTDVSTSSTDVSTSLQHLCIHFNRYLNLPGEDETLPTKPEEEFALIGSTLETLPTEPEEENSSTSRMEELD